MKTPETSGPNWAIRLCPMCHAMIVIRGTGDEGDPVMFPRHGGGACLEQDTLASVVLAAMRSAGADTAADVSADPALAAATLRIIGEQIGTGA